MSRQNANFPSNMLEEFKVNAAAMLNWENIIEKDIRSFFVKVSVLNK